MTSPYDIAAPRGPEQIKAAAQQLGLRMKDLYAMSEGADPFGSGRPAELRQAQWFADLWERFGYTRGVHLRRVHYQALSIGVDGPDGRPYENTQSCWAALKNASEIARDLQSLDPLALDDRRNDPPIRNVHPRYTDPEPPDWQWDEPSTWRVPSIGLWDLSVPRYDVGSLTVDGYDYTHDDDPVLVEVWIEKTTMDDVLVPVCSELHANLVRGAGFLSETQIHLLLQRIREHRKPARIFYIADFDPAGSFMATAVARNIEFYLNDVDADIALDRIALTPEQVAVFDLPRVPIKDEDNRKANFEAINGTGAVELDALEALHPGELRRIVRDAVTPYCDSGLRHRLEMSEIAAKNRADDCLTRESGPIRNALEAERKAIRTVTDRYKERLAALGNEMAQELAPHQERLDHLRGQLDEVVDKLNIDLPERPDAECEGTNEDGWLYRSDRHWWDQLAKFRVDRNVDAMPDDRECPACGQLFAPPRADSSFCSPACRQKAYRVRKAAGG